MHAPLTIQSWAHRTHEEGLRVVHVLGHLFHTKSFWAIVGILALIVVMFALIAHLGGAANVQHYGVPVPYSPYY